MTTQYSAGNGLAIPSGLSATPRGEGGGEKYYDLFSM